MKPTNELIESEMVDIIDRLRMYDDERLYEEADRLMSEAADEFIELRAFKDACEKQEVVAMVDEDGIIIVTAYTYKPGDVFYIKPDPEAAKLRMRVQELEAFAKFSETNCAELLEKNGQLATENQALRAKAQTAEKWSGIAASQVGLGLTLQRIQQEAIAEFLEKSGQWVTNEATHNAAMERVAEACADMCESIWENNPSRYKEAIDCEQAIRSGEWRKYLGETK